MMIMNQNTKERINFTYYNLSYTIQFIKSKKALVEYKLVIVNKKVGSFDIVMLLIVLTCKFIVSVPQIFLVNQFLITINVC